MPTAQDPPHHVANRAFYDRISGVYDWLADANEGPARRAGVEALAVRPGERVLELGFGTGNEVLELVRLVGPTGAVAGIDVSPGMLGVAREKLAADPPAAAVELRVGDARRLPFADESFDAVYTSFTLELFPAEDIPIVLAEVRRVLRDGGRVGVVSMAEVRAGDHPSALERGYVWMHRHFPHIVDCRPIDVAGVLTAAGFTLVSRQDLEIWTMPVGVVVARK
jgi:demethylmenaquinone methyltransferase/2-methoxy-6-polyprenyl-1,4-benzoquinol methylase